MTSIIAIDINNASLIFYPAPLHNLHWCCCELSKTIIYVYNKPSIALHIVDMLLWLCVKEEGCPEAPPLVYACHSWFSA